MFRLWRILQGILMWDRLDMSRLIVTGPGLAPRYLQLPPQPLVPLDSAPSCLYWSKEGL